MFPNQQLRRRPRHRFSPRERGCSHSRVRIHDVVSVFPARAGMFPSRWVARAATGSFPRASGDVPRWVLVEGLADYVFPARAGMFPTQLAKCALPRGFPRASGDVPTREPRSVICASFSPRERGCSRMPPRHCPRSRVFPARAGMFLATPVEVVGTVSFPRASGDVPRRRRVSRQKKRFSPRERGCSHLAGCGG